MVEIVEGKGIIFRKEVVQLKTTKIPKGAVVLETIFDNHDRSKLNTKEHDAKYLEEINLGTEDAQKRYISVRGYLLE